MQSQHNVFSIQLVDPESATLRKVVILPNVICQPSLSTADPKSIPRPNSSASSKMCLRYDVVRNVDNDLPLCAVCIVNDEGIPIVNRGRRLIDLPPPYDRKTVLSLQFDWTDVIR